MKVGHLGYEVSQEAHVSSLKLKDWPQQSLLAHWSGAGAIIDPMPLLAFKGVMAEDMQSLSTGFGQWG